MHILDFKGRAQAEKWREDIADLNNRTNEVLVNVGHCLEEIQTESDGDFVDRLVTTAADMLDAAAEMIKAIKSIEDLVGDVIKALSDFIGNAVQTVVDAHGRMTDL